MGQVRMFSWTESTHGTGFILERQQNQKRERKKKEEEEKEKVFLKLK